MKIQHAMCGKRTADSRCCAQTAVLWEVRSEHGFTTEVSAVYRAKNNKNAHTIGDPEGGREGREDSVARKAAPRECLVPRRRATNQAKPHTIGDPKTHKTKAQNVRKIGL